MKCPKCGAGLTALPVEDVTVDKCQSCDGIWPEYGELEKTVNPVPKGSRKCWKQNLEIHPLQ